MKGIVVDRKGRYAVVLTGDGSFIKTGNKAHFKIGYEIEIDTPFQLDRGVLARISSIAAVFMLFLGLNYGVYSYTTPYSYVDLDINPSIELTANIYDIIIKAETFNDDGKKLLEEHKMNFKKLDEGIAELVDSAIEKGYLKAQTENAVLLSVASKDKVKKEKLEENIGDAAVKALDKGKVDSAVISQQLPPQKHDAAKDIGISPGKLTLIEKAREANPELKLEELKDDSVKEIMKQIKESRKKEKEEDKEDKEVKEDKEKDKDKEEDTTEFKIKNVKQYKGNREQTNEVEQGGKMEDKKDTDKNNDVNSGKGKGNDKAASSGKDKEKDAAGKSNGGNNRDKDENNKNNKDNKNNGSKNNRGSSNNGRR